MDKSKRTFLKFKRSFRKRLPPIQSEDVTPRKNLSYKISTRVPLNLVCHVLNKRDQRRRYVILLTSER